MPVGVRSTSLSERLAICAGASAAIAALAGFFPGVYRDPPALIVQSHGQDLATLVVGLPVLFLGIRGSFRGRRLAQGALGYLLYTYMTYAFAAVLNPVTVLYIATVGCASWSLLLRQRGSEGVTPSRLPRRVTGVFLLALVFVFGLLWLSQIATAAMSGVRPQALVDAGWPTSPIYVLDLAFVLPLCAVTGVGLLRRRGDSLGAIPLLVFASLIAVGILSISLFASVDGQSLDGMQIAIFVVVATASALLAWLGLTPKRSPAADSRGLHPAQTASSTKNTSKTCVDF